MCRGCVFVQVDEESGGDIDGCFKADIIEDLENEFRLDQQAHAWLCKLQESINEESCFEELRQEYPTSPEEFKRIWKEWCTTREKAIKHFEKTLRKRIDTRDFRYLEIPEPKPNAADDHCQKKLGE